MTAATGIGADTGRYRRFEVPATRGFEPASLADQTIPAQVSAARNRRIDLAGSALDLDIATA